MDALGVRECFRDRGFAYLINNGAPSSVEQQPRSSAEGALPLSHWAGEGWGEGPGNGGALSAEFVGFEEDGL